MGSERFDAARNLTPGTDNIERNKLTTEAFSKTSESPTSPVVFNETNLPQAIKLAKESHLPIISIVTNDGKLDPNAKNAVSGNQDKAVFVSINRDNVRSMMNKGMSTPDFWSLANLSGAKGDVNNIHAGFIGRFDAETLNGTPAKDNLAPSAVARTNVSELLGASRSNDALPKISLEQLEVKSKSPQNLTDSAVVNAGSPGHRAAEATRSLADKTTIASPASQGDKTVNTAEQQERPSVRLESTKLSQVKFSTDDALEAVRIAKEKNLPIIVYKGADFCGNCPPVSSAVDRLSETLKSAPATEAVVLKLNWERQQKLQQENPELAKLVNQLMPLNGSSFPDVKVFNPNDLSKPLKDSNGYGGDAGFLNSLVKVGKLAMEEKNAPATREDKPAERPSDKASFEAPSSPRAPGAEGARRSFNQVETKENSKRQNSVESKTDSSWLELQQTTAAEKVQERPATEKVKLDQIKFAEAELSKAVDLAKQHNLPLVVYTGANFCHFCPGASANVDKVAGRLAASDSTKAIVVKLTAEVANSLAANNDSNGRLLAQVMAHGQLVPRIAIYNPNDMSNPSAKATIGNWSEDSIASHIDRNLNNTNRDSSVVSQVNPRSVSPHLFTEDSALQAAENARKNNKPLIAFVSDKSNPNVLKALEYLNEQKLASAVEVSKARTTKMLSDGLETRHFQALSNSLGGSSKQESSYLTATPGAAIGSDFKFTTQQRAVPGSPEQMIKFLKESGVELNEKHERALGALLDGKPVPQDRPANSFKVKEPAEAEQVLKQAREKGLPIIVHSPTTVCTDKSCTLDKLDAATPAKFADQALFLELPRGGLDMEGVDNQLLKSINDQFLVNDDDHKTQLDLHVFKFDGENLRHIDSAPVNAIGKAAHLRLIEESLKSIKNAESEALKGATDQQLPRQQD